MTLLKADTPVRSVTEVGPGDFVKVGKEWRRIAINTAEGSMLDEIGIDLYAKAEDLKE